MSVVNKVIGLDFNVDATAGIGGIVSEIKSKVGAEIKRAAWSWFNAHRDDVIYEKKIVLFTVKIKVSDCRKILEEIVGPENVAA